MKNNKFLNQKSGFTLVETMVAVFILVVVLTSLLGLIANNFFISKYARNEITATYLLQETVDYIRNHRDSEVFKGAYDGNKWNDFISKYSLCESDNGCHFDVPYNITQPLQITACTENPPSGYTIRCPFIKYDPDSNNKFYSYTGNGTGTIFRKRVIVMKNEDRDDEINIMVKIEWKNGRVIKSRELTTSLLNWQK